MSVPDSESSLKWPSERAFLHSLSTPLSTLGLVVDSALEIAKKSGNPEDLANAERMTQLIDKIFKMIQDRRSELPQGT